jgi:hypothetical protein
MNRKTYHMRLLALHDCVKAEDILYPNRGICFNVSSLGKTDSAAFNLTDKYAMGWPEHSGITNRPVPFEYGADLKWVGEEGASRLRLLNYLIRKTR